LEGHRAAIRDISFAPSGDRVATASEDGTVRLWNARTCRAQRTINVRGDAIWSARFSPDSSEIVVSSQRFDNVRVFYAATGAEIALLLGHQGAVFSAAFSPRDGRRVVSASADTTARVWTLPPRNLANRRALVADVCSNRLANGLAALSD